MRSRKPHPRCLAKHTRYQPTDAEFRCPKCDAKAGDFAVEEESDDAHSDCAALHAGDSLCCYTCGYGTTGLAFARRIARRKNLVECPTCKGTGLVRKEEP